MTCSQKPSHLFNEYIYKKSFLGSPKSNIHCLRTTKIDRTHNRHCNSCDLFYPFLLTPLQAPNITKAILLLASIGL